jgi:hypothetical protein
MIYVRTYCNRVGSEIRSAFVADYNDNEIVAEFNGLLFP